MTENRYLENVALVESTGSALEDIRKDRGEAAWEAAIDLLLKSLREKDRNRLLELIRDRLKNRPEG